MEYLKFTLMFFVVHTVAYYVAGTINYYFSKNLYGGRDQLYESFLRNMSDKAEARRVGRWLIPAQLARAVGMSVVLYPVLGALGEMSFMMRFAFMGGIMFVYADCCSAIPFSNTIEGLIYMKKEFVRRKIFWLIQSEAVVYSLIFGLASAWLLF
jgi:hypothetical protein